MFSFRKEIVNEMSQASPMPLGKNKEEKRKSILLLFLFLMSIALAVRSILFVRGGIPQIVRGIFRNFRFPPPFQFLRKKNGGRGDEDSGRG